MFHEEFPPDWDQPLSPKSRKMFISALERLLLVGGVMWSRPPVSTFGYKVTKNSPAMVYTGSGSPSYVTGTAHLVTELLDNDPNKKDGIINHVALVEAKSYLASLANRTIPRTELAASRLCTTLSTAVPPGIDIPIKRNFYFTNSPTVLDQILSNKPHKDERVTSHGTRSMSSRTQPLSQTKFTPHHS